MEEQEESARKEVLALQERTAELQEVPAGLRETPPPPVVVVVVVEVVVLLGFISPELLMLLRMAVSEAEVEAVVPAIAPIRKAAEQEAQEEMGLEMVDQEEQLDQMEVPEPAAAVAVEVPAVLIHQVTLMLLQGEEVPAVLTLVLQEPQERLALTQHQELEELVAQKDSFNTFQQHHQRPLILRLQN